MLQPPKISFQKAQSSQQQLPVLNAPKSSFDNQSILAIIDKSLKHLNQISEANIVAQQLYIELLKQKKTMKFDQIKKIYCTFTQGKAKQILFERDKKQLLQTDYHNHQSLSRLCWRSLQKLVKKITYYMINQNHLSIISKNVLKLIHLNQQFVRRFSKVKNSSMLFILEIIQKLIQENSILQKKIYQILLNRGYVVSLDQFYKLNGYDAQHRESYYAKQGITQQKQKSSSQDQDNQSANILFQKKQSNANSKKQALRKKKGFRINCRYSWKQKIIETQQIQQKQKFRSNKTNFQIRESFQKFIGDFLQNYSLNQFFLKYTSEGQSYKQKSKTKPQKAVNTNPDTVLHKKIFESKIQTLINQLKTNNIKISSKILQIIDNSSNEAISAKVNLGQKKFNTERKNSQKRDSSNLLSIQRKLRESYVINDRKIINENFFRELLRRNTILQNYVNQEILNDTQKLQQQFIQSAYTNCNNNKGNNNIIQFFSNSNKKAQKQNQVNSINNKIKNILKFAQPKKGNAVFLFHKQNQEINNNIKESGNKNKYLQTELNCKYKIQTRKQLQSKKYLDSNKNQPLTQKIRILKQQAQIRNQKSILEAIQNATLQPGNPLKFAQMLKYLNNKKVSDLCAGRQNEFYMLQLQKSFKQQGQIILFNKENKKQNSNIFRRFKTQIIQSSKQKSHEYTANSTGFYESIKNQRSKYQYIQTTSKLINQNNRLKTQHFSSRQKYKKHNTIGKIIKFSSGFDAFNSNKKYQVYDRRLRRFLIRR